MAEENQGFPVRRDGPVEHPLPYIAVLRQKPVELPANPLIFLPDIPGGHQRGVQKSVLVIISRHLGPVCRQQIPGQPFLSGQRILYHVGEFLQPVFHLGLEVQLLQSQRGSIPCPPQRGDIIGIRRGAHQLFTQQSGLAPALFGQGILFIIGIAVANDYQFHKRVLLFSPFTHKNLVSV